MKFGIIIDSCNFSHKQINIMKKLMLIAALGVIAVSCGTKESSMSNSSTDSTAVDNATTSAAPATTDTMTTTTTPADTMSVKADSATTVK